MSIKIDCLLERNNFKLDVQLEVEPRSVLAITGENGSGKTSTLDMISGLLACTEGKILLNDKVFDDATCATLCKKYGTSLEALLLKLSQQG